MHYAPPNYAEERSSLETAAAELLFPMNAVPPGLGLKNHANPGLRPGLSHFVPPALRTPSLALSSTWPAPVPSLLYYLSVMAYRLRRTPHLMRPPVSRALD